MFIAERIPRSALFFELQGSLGSEAACVDDKTGSTTEAIITNHIAVFGRTGNTAARRRIPIFEGGNSPPCAVVIIPVLDDGRICLIRNFRISLNQELLELPAGTLEPPEPPIETARRELIEETGYRCRDMVPLCDFYMSPGILDEHLFCFLATGLASGNTALEHGEQITNFPVTISELTELLRDGKIKDSKSISALLYYAMLGPDDSFRLLTPNSKF